MNYITCSVCHGTGEIQQHEIAKAVAYEYDVIDPMTGDHQGKASVTVEDVLLQNSSLKQHVTELEAQLSITHRSAFDAHKRVGYLEAAIEEIADQPLPKNNDELEGLYGWCVEIARRVRDNPKERKDG